MDNEFYNSQNYFIIDTDNGNTISQQVKIIKKDNKLTASALPVNVYIKNENDNEIAQNATIKSNNNHKLSNDLEIIGSEIADLFNIPSSKVFRLNTDNNLEGIINIIPNIKETSEVSFTSLLTKYINLLQSKNLSTPTYLTTFINLTKQSQPLTLINEIEQVINFPLTCLSSLLQINEKDLEQITKEYIRMLYFNLIINNNTYNFNNYSFNLKNKEYSATLAPLYKYPNNIEESDIVSFNNTTIFKENLLDFLYQKYYNYLRDISRSISENFNVYIKSINLIINNNTDLETAKIYANTIYHNISKIKEYELLHQVNNPESRLDFTMTQTTINLNAINRNQIVLNKYPKTKTIAPTPVSEEKELVAIKVEPTNHTNHAANFILIIIGILLILGIGVGIAFLFFNLYN